jgi:aryl-alcohol dehydrogenase-like predicted oxidoreductase
MEYRRLGESDLDVSVLSFGAWQLGDPGYWGAGGAAKDAVRAAIDCGVNLFDTAELYGDGESERVLGKALGSKRDSVLIASKIGPQHGAPGQVKPACEASLERLGTDRIDLYQVHWPFGEEHVDEVRLELESLCDEGKVRYLGVSNFGTQDLDRWLPSTLTVSNQLGYNLLFRAIEHEIIPACQRNNLGVLAYMPLMQGLLAGKWRSVEDVPANRRRTRHFAASRDKVRHGEAGEESLTFHTLGQIEAIAEDAGVAMADLAICWLAGKPGVTSVIAGARKPGQVEGNAKALERMAELKPVCERLDRVTDLLRERLGPNPDMWKTAEEGRIH